MNAHLNKLPLVLALLLSGAFPLIAQTTYTLPTTTAAWNWTSSALGGTGWSDDSSASGSIADLRGWNGGSVAATITSSQTRSAYQLIMDQADSGGRRVLGGGNAASALLIGAGGVVNAATGGTTVDIRTQVTLGANQSWEAGLGGNNTLIMDFRPSSTDATKLNLATYNLTIGDRVSLQFDLGNTLTTPYVFIGTSGTITAGGSGNTGVIGIGSQEAENNDTFDLTGATLAVTSANIAAVTFGRAGQSGTLIKIDGLSGTSSLSTSRGGVSFTTQNTTPATTTTVELVGSGTYSMDARIRDSSSSPFTGSALLIKQTGSGAQTFAGTGTAATGGASWNSSAALQVDNGTFIISGDKNGAGTMTVGTGGTAAKLLVNGTAAGAVTVGALGIFGGIGTVSGALTVNNNGTIQPTISAANGGTLTLSSATAPTFNATAKLKIRAPSSTLDKVSLSHATPTFACGNVALIIDTTGLSGDVTGATIVQTANASGISGTFASVTVVGNASYTPTLHYNANSITVDLVAAPSCTTPSSTITADAAVCASSTGNLASVPDANTGGNSGATYAWTISNGTITSAANIRQITYTAGASGSVTLNCTVAVTGGCSSGGAQNQTVSINDLPVANAGAYTCAPGLSVAIRVPDLASDPENATIFANVVVAPTNGTAAVVTIGGEPYFYYLNTNAAAASDAFTYTVSDGQCISASATISLTVAVSNTQSQNSLAPPETIGEGPDVRLKFLGLPGSHYALEWTHQLSPITNWVVLGTNVASVNGLVVFTNMPSGEVMDLYRTRWVP
jgi:hypothetical protein